MPTEFPPRGTRPYDVQLKSYIDSFTNEAIQDLTRAVTERSVNATKAGYDAARSNGYAQAAAAKATRFVEPWAGLTQWAVVGSSLQVSASKVYGTGSGGGGGNHSFRVAPGETARVVFRVNIVGSGAINQGVLLGFNRETVGATPMALGQRTRGVFFKYGGGASDTVVQPCDDFTFGGSVLTGIGTQTFIVTFTVDEKWQTVAVASSTGAMRWVGRWARNDSTRPVNNINIVMNDTRGLTGSSVEVITEATIGGPSAAFVSGDTITPQAAPTMHWGSDNGANVLIQCPPGYDSRKPWPAVMMFHGLTANETSWIYTANEKAVAQAFLDAGFVVIGAGHFTDSTTWGNDTGLDVYVHAYQYARDHYNIGALAMYAISMGGIESLNTLADTRVPGVAAWVGAVPTYDLAQNRARGYATIDTAYGGNYEVNSVGHDPALMNPLAFRGVPMMVVRALDDASVTPSANATALIADVADTNPVTVVDITGGHSSASIGTSGTAMAAFCVEAIGHRTAWTT